ncbi:unnamed protein product [Dibothriocephalus latus]|uniref:RRM domain-containing protein n=1 Tax=Dibothriocephalus latus TaxID=60516 RepID=A0A3P7M7B2_DIBLA|nr:unnamed protein product [Dibothriocephalus latus]
MGSYGRSPPRIEGMVSLKVDNLAYRTTLEDLRRVFGRYGEVGDIYIPRNPYSQESRGFAFVRFYTDRDADAAIRGMDGRRIDGREIRVQRAMYGRPNSRVHHLLDVDVQGLIPHAGVLPRVIATMINTQTETSVGTAAHVLALEIVANT